MDIEEPSVVLNNKQKVFEFISNFGKEFMDWLKGLSERTLSLSSIAILHVAFLPGMVAYLNGLTDKLPSLDTYLIVLAALVVMNLRSILKGDKVANLIHLAGFVSQIIVVAFVLLK